MSRSESDAELVVLRRLTDGSVRVEIHAELCDQGCGERVRYWNDDDGGDGNASCGCCHEGPEACAEIMMYPQVHDLLRDALAQLEADRKRKIHRELLRAPIARVGVDRRRPSARLPLNMGAFDFDLLIELEGGRAIEGEVTLVRTQHNTWRTTDELDYQYGDRGFGWIHGSPMRDYFDPLTPEAKSELVDRILHAKNGESR